MTITLDLNVEQLKNLKVLIDIIYDNMYRLSNPNFKNILDTINKAVDTELENKQKTTLK